VASHALLPISLAVDPDTMRLNMGLNPEIKASVVIAASVTEPNLFCQFE
jgi:hypothetical protein